MQTLNPRYILECMHVYSKFFSKNSQKNQFLSFLIVFSSFFSDLKGQTQLELASGSMSSVNVGGTISNQTATKLQNTSGSTFATFNPTFTVTASFSNQQYTNIATNIVNTGTGMLFGLASNSYNSTGIDTPVYSAMNTFGLGSNANYTSNPNGTAGTSIDVASNYSFNIYNSVHSLFTTSASLTGRFYYGDITFTFNHPVSNPVLHLSGLGANLNFGGGNIQGFSTEMELFGSNFTLTRLSGSSEFDVNSGLIKNNATTYSGNCGSGAACGSVRVNGTNITSISFKVYIKGDGNGTAWSHSNINSGDNFSIGFSMNAPVNITGNVFEDINGLTDNIVNGTGTNVAGALRVNLVDVNNNVVSTTTVAVDGTYSFVGIGDGNYTVQLSTNAGTQGSAAPAIALPIGIVNTGENVGSGTGSDGTINGILPVTVSGNNVSNANFGIYSCATITNPSASQTICIGQSGSNITVNTSSAISNGIRFVRFTSDQIAGTTPTVAELANIYTGTPISTVTAVSNVATYVWNSADFPNTTSSPITYYVYAIINPDAGITCRPVQEVTITVNALPTIAAITGTTTVCNTQTTTLSNSTSGGVWSSLSPSVATIDASGVVTGVSAGTSIIRYKVTNANGCKDSVSTTVTVNALPVIAAITGTTTVCATITTQLSNATASGTWVSRTPGVATINASGLVTGVSAGTATIRYIVTNGSGCSDSVSTTVTVNALPIVNALTGTQDVCIGNTTTFVSTTNGGVWSSSNSGVATVNASGVISGITAGTSTITYTVTNANGCVTSVSRIVTVNTLPVVPAIVGSNIVPVGITSALTNAVSGGVWSSSNPAIATVNNSGQVTGILFGTAIISYTVTNASGCVTTVTYQITINPKVNG